MFTVFLKKPKTQTHNFFQKKDYWISPPFYPECPSFGIWSIRSNINPHLSYVSNLLELQHHPRMVYSITHPKKPSRTGFVFVFLLFWLKYIQI